MLSSVDSHSSDFIRRLCDRGVGASGWLEMTDLIQTKGGNRFFLLHLPKDLRVLVGRIVILFVRNLSSKAVVDLEEC